MKNSIGLNFTYCTKIILELIFTLIIHQAKYLAFSIFGLKGDREKFFQGENFPTYDMVIFTE